MIFVDGEYFEVGVEPVRKVGAVSAQRSYQSGAGVVSQKPAATDGKGTKLLAPVPGMIIWYEKNQGDKLKKERPYLSLKR